MTALCAAASEELLARLREGVKPEDIKDRFVMAAGVLALSMYMALGKGEKPSSIRAGNLSVGFSGDRASAASLRKQAEALLAAYLEDQGFDFVGVRA